MADYTLLHRKNADRDRRRSALLTVLVSVLVFLAIYFYRFTKTLEKPETVTTMLINFGDETEGAQTEEPLTQEGSLASSQEEIREETTSLPNSQPEIAKSPPEKILTGTNTKVSAPKAPAESKKSTTKTAVSTKPSAPAKSTAPAKSAAADAPKSSPGDGKGAAAIGNLLKGRGTKPGSQGTTPGTTGNLGDPLGGEANGDSKIGVDRKLISFIPGTMGRGGAQPAHTCTASGTVNIAYTVDKAGNVTSARRLSGISDPCAVRTTVAWVKQYVKAERANTSSTGTYQITF